MLLDEKIISQLREYFKVINRPVSFHVKKPKDNMLSFLKEITSICDKLSIVNDENLPYRENSFEIFDIDKPTGIVFSGIPGGHEFNSFILAILSIFGLGTKLTEKQLEKIKNIKEKKVIEVFVTLSCTFCPDVVQSLNRIALNNEFITVNTIDGNEYIEEAREKNVLVSPSVFINGNFTISGANPIDKLIEVI